MGRQRNLLSLDNDSARDAEFLFQKTKSLVSFIRLAFALALEESQRKTQSKKMYGGGGYGGGGFRRDDSRGRGGGGGYGGGRKLESLYTTFSLLYSYSYR